MEWISVKDRLPSREECEKSCGWFLVWQPNWTLRAEMSRYDGHNEEYSHEHGWKYSWNDHVTHWMILPEAPKECQSDTKDMPQ